MDRRKFLAASLASAAVAAAPRTGARESQEAAAQGAREYYQLRRYHLLTQQKKLADDYFRNALAPGLNRLGISPVGVFSVSIGTEGPSMIVLMPSTSVDMLVTADFRLSQDAEYVKAAGDFLNAPAKSPAFVRMESSLMQSLAGAPKLTVPAATAQHSPRLFELRTYESSTDQDHKAKVAQVNEGEIPIFLKAGFWPVFFGDTLIGDRLPNLTYMIGFANLAERDKVGTLSGRLRRPKSYSHSRNIRLRISFRTSTTRFSRRRHTPRSRDEVCRIDGQRAFEISTLRPALTRFSDSDMFFLLLAPGVKT